MENLERPELLNSQQSVPVMNDAGASGECSDLTKPKPTLANELPTEESQNSVSSHHGPGILTLTGYFILRTVFILAAIAILIVVGLYTAKLTGIYDPCEQFSLTSSDCTYTPYMNGLFYFVDCYEETECLLHGFGSFSGNTYWSFTGPPTPSTTTEDELLELMAAD